MTPNGFAQVCYSLSNIEKTMLRVVYEWRVLEYIEPMCIEAHLEVHV